VASRGWSVLALVVGASETVPSVQSGELVWPDVQQMRVPIAPVIDSQSHVASLAPVDVTDDNPGPAWAALGLSASQLDVRRGVAADTAEIPWQVIELR